MSAFPTHELVQEDLEIAVADSLTNHPGEK